jgi:hypothetical protein
MQSLWHRLRPSPPPDWAVGTLRPLPLPGENGYHRNWCRTNINSTAPEEADTIATMKIKPIPRLTRRSDDTSSGDVIAVRVSTSPPPRPIGLASPTPSSATRTAAKYYLHSEAVNVSRKAFTPPPVPMLGANLIAVTSSPMARERYHRTHPISYWRRFYSAWIRSCLNTALIYR